MICEITKDETFLKKKSLTATKEDISIAKDLVDTLRFHQSECLGMAANMISQNKNIIAFYQEEMIMVMFNPIIVEKEDAYNANEGCLSLKGVRHTKRYQNITVSFYDMRFKKHTRKYSAKVAQTIQHEIDHLHGIII